MKPCLSKCFIIIVHSGGAENNVIFSLCHAVKVAFSERKGSACGFKLPVFLHLLRSFLVADGNVQSLFQKELDKVGVAHTHAYERYFFILHIFKKDLGFRSHIQKVLHIKIVTHNILYYCFPKMAIDFIYKFLYMEIYGLMRLISLYIAAIWQR